MPPFAKGLRAWLFAPYHKICTSQQASLSTGPIGKGGDRRTAGDDSGGPCGGSYIPIHGNRPSGALLAISREEDGSPSGCLDLGQLRTEFPDSDWGLRSLQCRREGASLKLRS